ncbi:hypothetical protein GCM10023158_09700 [Gluconacetobacter tumulicola]
MQGLGQRVGVTDRLEQVHMGTQGIRRVADDGPAAERQILLGDRRCRRGAETSAHARGKKNGCNTHGGAMRRTSFVVKRRCAFVSRCLPAIPGSVGLLSRLRDALEFDILLKS